MHTEHSNHSFYFVSNSNSFNRGAPNSRRRCCISRQQNNHACWFLHVPPKEWYRVDETGQTCTTWSQSGNCLFSKEKHTCCYSNKMLDFRFVKFNKGNSVLVFSDWFQLDHAASLCWPVTQNLLGRGGGGDSTTFHRCMTFCGSGGGEAEERVCSLNCWQFMVLTTNCRQKKCIFLVSFLWHKFLKEIFSFLLVKCKNDKNQSFISEITRKPFICEDGVV